MYLSFNGDELILQHFDVFFLGEVSALVLHTIQLQHQVASLYLHRVEPLGEVQNVGLEGSQQLL